MGKDVLSSASIPLDNKSVLSIANVLLPILRKNLYNKLSSCGISPTHECVNDGEIWGCDINSKMFYNTFSSIHIYKFSDLRDVTMEDLRNNPNVKSNYRITVTVKDDFWTDGWDYTIYVDNEFILNNLLSMFKGIKERQYSYDSVGGQQNIDIMDGHEFEYFCAELLKKNGYENVDVTQGSGDQGIDVIAYKDGIKYGIQCKCYSSDIGNKAVQEVFAGKVFYECHVGVVLTNRFFTKSAEELAKKNGIILWDRKKLLELMENI
ncbi:MAG: restriction endonuclease [Firmicutes bacterium]|nr:restriction endonuclease [Bacillota bacterium]